MMYGQCVDPVRCRIESNDHRSNQLVDRDDLPPEPSRQYHSDITGMSVNVPNRITVFLVLTNRPPGAGLQNGFAVWPLADSRVLYCSGVRMRRPYGANFNNDPSHDRDAGIGQAGTGATLQECRELAERINAKLRESAPEQFDEVLTAAELQTLLERAAAVLKNCDVSS
jgi:hypothetical protein